MMSRLSWRALASIVMTACGGTTEEPAEDASARVEPPEPPEPISTCGAPGAVLQGAQYDVTKTKFAFGAPPGEPILDNGRLRYRGPFGDLFVGPPGAAIAVSNLGSPASSLPPWSSPNERIEDHVRAYFETWHAIPACQVSRVSGVYSGKATMIGLSRTLDGIGIGSRATAQFNSEDRTTDERVLWPPIPRAIVDEAYAFRAELADPAKLAAFREKLPERAREGGGVEIHHDTRITSGGHLSFMVTWDVLADISPLSFDTSGRLVLPP